VNPAGRLSSGSSKRSGKFYSVHRSVRCDDHFVRYKFAANGLCEYNPYMVFEHECYQSYLRDVFAKQVAQNPRYSLRAFARKLGIAASSLSEVLSGKKKISHAMALKIASQLNLREKERTYFTLLADLDSARTETLRHEITKKIETYHRRRNVVTLDVELFRAISEWYHVVLMEMTNLKDVNFDPRVLAPQLGITAVEVNAALQRLVKLGLIKKGADRKYQKSESQAVFASAEKNQALRKFHQQMLGLASNAPETQKPADRFVGSETFVFDEKLIPEANAILEDCFDKMIELSNRSKTKKRVYHFGMQLFSVTKTGETK
jgi:uncharacterized protein (TIGR02147 family)